MTSAQTRERRTAAVRTDDGAVLHVTIDGSDDAPVTLVLAHGWTLSQASWDDPVGRLVPRIAAGELRLVRYDQRGHGRSTWAPADDDPAAVTIDRLGLDLGCVLDRLAPSGPVVVAGHSMGGMTIMCLAAARPELFGDRVRGALLVSTSAGELGPPPGTAKERMARRFAPGLVAAAVGGARVIEGLRRLTPPESRQHRRIVRGLLYGADATDEMVREGAEIMHATTVRAFAVFYPALGDHDKRTELAALARVPVEILVGTSDGLTPVRHSRALAEALPDAVLHVEPRTGHMLLQERPQLVVDALGRLLARAADRVTA
ncbi:alpha/beta fold hydrolase [Blastococcus sp. URHD0036]|uniref:alpha/beta fold hydrolase n=1 Tax=Blastococcus sp. URHD0036 TaxID=1380356 RepID=UPI0004950BB5|nr:alpha/beta hydrolase [Blastococcus sp. URHD0036]